MKDGWSGLWDEHISKNLQGIAGTVVDSITGWIEKKVVIEAVKYIISLFNPVAALLKAIQMGWNIYTFIKENFTKMMNLVSAFTNELANIAQGNVSNAINFVESALAKGLTLGIKLLAKLLNIDKIARAVNEALEKIHDKIDTAINQLIDWLKEQAGSLLNGSNNGGSDSSNGNSNSNNSNKNTVSNPNDLPKASKSTETQGTVKLQFTKRGSNGVQADIEDSKEFDGLWDPVAQPKLKRKIDDSLPGQKPAAQASLSVADNRIDEATAEGKKRIDKQEDISGYLSYVQTAVTALADTIDLCTRRHQIMTLSGIKARN